jgi:hypothetical protein
MELLPAGCMGLVLFLLTLWISGASAASQEGSVSTAYQVKEHVEGRVHATSPVEPLRLGESNEVGLDLHGYKVHAIYANMKYYDDDTNGLVSSDDREEVSVARPDGSTYVSVVPNRLGHLKMNLEVQFTDGGAESTMIEADVVLPAQDPAKFLVARGGTGTSRTSGTLYMDLSETRESRLAPLVAYDETTRPVPIPAKYVRFSVIAPATVNAPIVVDQSTGQILSLHLGHALVEASFRGLSVLVCVDVKTLASDGSESSDCGELVPPGTAPPAGTMGRKPPSKIVVPVSPR